MFKQLFAGLGALAVSFAVSAPVQAQTEGQLTPAEQLAEQTLCHTTAIDKSAPATIARMRKQFEKDDWIEGMSDRYPDYLDVIMLATGNRMREVMQQDRAGCVKAIGAVYGSEMTEAQIAAARAYLQSEMGKVHHDYILKELLYGEIIKQAERVWLDEITKEQAIEAYELNLSLASFAVLGQVGMERGVPMVAYAQSPDGIAFTNAMGEAVEPWRQWTGRVVQKYSGDLIKAGSDAGTNLICSDTRIDKTSQARREFCRFKR